MVLGSSSIGIGQTGAISTIPFKTKWFLSIEQINKQLNNWYIQQTKWKYILLQCQSQNHPYPPHYPCTSKTLSDSGIRHTVATVRISRSFLWYAINDLMHVMQLMIFGYLK